MWRMRRSFYRYDKGPIVILQMGKVGSKSVQAGLEACVSDRPIYHAHFLSHDRTARTENQRRKFFRTDRYTYLMRPWLNQFLLRTFQRQRDDRTWKLVTLTREPVSRNISAFFENLHVTPLAVRGEYEIRSDYYEIPPTVVSESDVEILKELFISRATHDSPVRFFDREIREIFGIDVLATGFSIEKGYQIYRHDRVELLVLKLEDLAQCAGEAFRQFLSLENFELINQNVGAEKVYAPLYRAFKSKVRLDQEYVDGLLGSEYMRTFYREDEIRSAREKWLRD